MWLFDTNHPNFFVRLLARLAWMIVSIVTLVVVGSLIVWGYDTFGHHDLAHEVKDKISWAWSGGWKRVVTGILAIVVFGPLLLDMLFGDSNQTYVNNHNNADRQMVTMMRRQERENRRAQRRNQRNGGGGL